MLWRALEFVGRGPGVRPARWLASVAMRLRRRYAVDRLRMVLRKPDPAPGLWKVPARWLTGPVRVRRLGLRLELDLRDNLARTMYFTGTYEPELVRFLSRLRPGEVGLFADARYDIADAGVRSVHGTGTLVATARVTTLDACGLDRLDVLKADVEGAEAAVLEGARDSLVRLRPRAVIVESKGHGDADRVRSVLGDCGYEPSGQVLDGTNELWITGR